MSQESDGEPRSLGNKSRARHYFLKDSDAKFFESLCSVVVPEGIDPRNDPGAITVGALNYIDSTLSDFPKEVQDYFAAAIKTVNDVSLAKFSRPFPGSSRSRQEHHPARTLSQPPIARNDA